MPAFTTKICRITKMLCSMFAILESLLPAEFSGMPLSVVGAEHIALYFLEWKYLSLYLVSY